jgi:hypothetical protein
MTRKLYKYSESFGRMGTLEGVFTAEEADVEKLQGQRVYFGEALGKHSEITGKITAETVTVIEKATPEFVALFDELGLVTGYDPVGPALEKLEEEDEDYDEDEDVVELSGAWAGEGPDDEDEE